MRAARADSRSQFRSSLRRRALPLAVALVVLPVSLAAAGGGGGESGGRAEFEPGCQPPERTEAVVGRPYLGPDDPAVEEPPGEAECPWDAEAGAVDPVEEPPDER